MKALLLWGLPLLLSKSFPEEKVYLWVKQSDY